ncbi:MAG: dephospho-CoA kinase [Acidobacteriota bacterium]
MPSEPVIVIGLTGPNAAGKGEVARYLASRGFACHSLSDIVREQALAAGGDVSRESLIETGRRLRREGGPGILAEMLVPRLEGRAVVDSIRHPAEVAVLRRLPAFRLLGVDADVSVRFERARRRARAGDAPDLDGFRAQEALENRPDADSQQLAATLALADAVVRNEGTIDELIESVRAVLAGWGVEP